MVSNKFSKLVLFYLRGKGMKKSILVISIVFISLIVSGCTKLERNTEKSNVIDSSTEKTSDSFKVSQPSSEELKGEPNGKITPEINETNIDNFSDYDQLTKEEKNEVVYDYLLKALGALFGGEKEINKLLSEKSYTPENLEEKVSEIREENSDLDFHDVMNDLIQSIIEESD